VGDRSDLLIDQIKSNLLAANQSTK